MPSVNNYKEQTKETYEKFSDKFDEKFEGYIVYIKKEIEIFLKSLKGKKILDVGSGPGNHSAVFRTRGFEPLCVDISENMIDLCKKKGLDARVRITLIYRNVLQTSLF